MRALPLRRPERQAQLRRAPAAECEATLLSTRQRRYCCSASGSMSETTSEPNQIIECFYRSYERWLGLKRDPHDLLITYSSEPMTMWPISTRVNKPETLLPITSEA